MDESPSAHDIVDAGRTVGAISGAIVCIVALYFLATASQPGMHVGHGGAIESGGHGYDIRLDWVPTILGGLLAVIGALFRRPLIMIGAFVAGFFWNFLGLYTLLLPLGIANLIGLGELGYLLSAALLWWGGSGGVSRK